MPHCEGYIGVARYQTMKSSSLSSSSNDPAENDLQHGYWDPFWSGIATYCRSFRDFREVKLPDSVRLLTGEDSEAEILNRPPLYSLSEYICYAKIWYRQLDEFNADWVEDESHDGRHRHSLFWKRLQACTTLDRSGLKSKGGLGMLLDPHEVGFAISKFLLLKKRSMQDKSFWYGPVPDSLPRCHAERVLLSTRSIDAVDRVRVLQIGDIHGCVGNVLNVLQQLHVEGKIDSSSWKILDPEIALIFTGDLTDRGLFGLEVWLMVIYLITANPRRVFLLKANHEFGAEGSFQYSECPSKLFLNKARDFNDIFRTVSCCTPDVLFVQVYNEVENKWTSFVYSHGALDHGYNPSGFLHAPPHAVAPFPTPGFDPWVLHQQHPVPWYHNVPLLVRTPFYEFLQKNYPAISFRLRNCKDLEVIPPVVQPDPEAEGAGFVWNSYDGEGAPLLSIATYGNGVSLNEEMLRMIFVYWASASAPHSDILKLSHAKAKKWQPRDDRVKVVLQFNCGGHEHGPSRSRRMNFLKDARENGGFATAFPLSPTSQRFLVYKCFNMQDVPLYRLKNVSFTELKCFLTASDSWTMTPHRIQDNLGFTVEFTYEEGEEHW